MFVADEMAPRSKLFCPYQVMGLVTLDMPFLFSYSKKMKMYYISVPLGNAMHIYKASNFHLVAVSKPLGAVICCNATGTQDCTGTTDGKIQIWSKGTTSLIIDFQCHNSPVRFLSVIGPIIVSVDDENILKVSQQDGSLYLEWKFSPEFFQITALMHPPTYLNKVLVGSKQGKMQLLNIKTSKVIYEFSGWDSGVSVIEEAPALDIVAIGLDDGRIIIHNIKFDESVLKLQQETGKVTALCFRSDNNARLLSGCVSGSISVWDLEERCLKSTVKKAHNCPILSLACASKEPLAFTSSSDNILKSWAFDMCDGGGRLLKERSGHSKPPLHARYHGQSGDVVVSGGQDASLRTSWTKTSRSTIVAKAISNTREKKANHSVADLHMPPIVQFHTETAREKNWDSVAAIHQNNCSVTTWSIYLSKINSKKLCHGRFKNKQYDNCMATSITMSMCGNFVFVGYSSGHIDKFNMQSGIYQHSYGSEDTKHLSAVRGIVTDSLNHFLVSGDQNGVLQWWAQRKADKMKTLELNAGVCIMSLHRDSGLFAIALDDWSILVADVDTKCVVRKLQGHQNQITDMTFSGDSKWLISSSMDCSIRVWDLPTGNAIDHFMVATPATSISLSPIDDYLATTHVNELGVYLWANRSCLTFVSLQPLGNEHAPPLLPLPGSLCDGSHAIDSDSEDSDLECDIEQDDYKSPDQLSNEFVTIDLMPSSRWLNLLKIDQIKKRNKPDVEPKTVKSAPFFLESVSGIVAQNNDKDENDIKSKVIDASSFLLETLSPFGLLLKSGEHESAFDTLVLMGPSNIDLEIRNLDPDIGGSRDAMLQFLHMILKMLESHKHFEVAQGYLGLFMKRHSDFITTPDADVEAVCKDLLEQQVKSWHVLKGDVNKSLSLLSYLKNSAILNY